MIEKEDLEKILKYYFMQSKNEFIRNKLLGDRGLERMNAGAMFMIESIQKAFDIDKFYEDEDLPEYLTRAYSESIPEDFFIVLGNEED